MPDLFAYNHVCDHASWIAVAILLRGICNVLQINCLKSTRRRSLDLIAYNRNVLHCVLNRRLVYSHCVFKRYVYAIHYIYTCIYICIRRYVFVLQMNFLKSTRRRSCRILLRAYNHV